MDTEEEAPAPCGRTRPGTLGYQYCQRPKRHEGLHCSQDRTEWDAVAYYHDGAGWWTVIRIGDMLTTFTPNGESLPSYLERAPQYDGYLDPEFVLTERYAACDDYGDNGVVWIDYLAYTLD